MAKSARMHWDVLCHSFLSPVQCFYYSAMNVLSSNRPTAGSVTSLLRVAADWRARAGRRGRCCASWENGWRTERTAMKLGSAALSVRDWTSLSLHQSKKAHVQTLNEQITLTHCHDIRFSLTREADLLPGSPALQGCNEVSRNLKMNPQLRIMSCAETTRSISNQSRQPSAMRSWNPPGQRVVLLQL